MSIKETINGILQDCGVQLYDVESVSEHEQKIYRIYITAVGGVSLDKCAEVTRILSPILDMDPPLKGAYTLEVSSPGIERSLKTLSHYQCSIGEYVKVKLINTDKIIGKLQSVEGNKILLLEDDGQETLIDLDEVEKARTYYKW